MTSILRSKWVCWHSPTHAPVGLHQEPREANLKLAAGQGAETHPPGLHRVFPIFLGSKITADCDCSHEIKRCLLLGRKVMTNLDSMLKSRDISLPTKVHLVKVMIFPLVMWGLDFKESWAVKNWCFWTVVLEKILESPLDCKEIQQVHPKGDQSWVFFGKNDVKAETPVLWLGKKITFNYKINKFDRSNI